MKNITTLSLSLMLTLLVSLNVFAGSGSETIKIKTDAVCCECKDRIEGNVVKLKGVKNAVLNLEDKILTVTYNSDKVSATDIKKAVTDTGYSADEIAGSDKARTSLPHCCQPDGHKH